MASQGNPPFDMNKLFRPSVMGMGLQSPIPSPTTSGNLATSPSFPAHPSAPPPQPYLAPSSSFPPPSTTYPFHYMAYPSPPRPPSPATPTSGSDLLLAFFGNQNQSQTVSTAPSAPPIRSASSKLPRGRHVFGNEVVYDIDVRLQGEVQPQLEVTPITKYGSDPGLVLGRQIAVNRSYICYGLKLGNIRILNINTALRSLFRGHTQRVTDMAFFAEDVHLLASASVDGRVFVWKINEGPDEEDKPQIFGKVIIALQIIGQGQPMHPRVCWHPHKQEILMVAVGNRILKIDTIKVAKLEGFSAEEPLNCPVDKLIDGVQFVGKHDGEITELSMCQWLTTRLASASVDGTVRIWDDRKAAPLAVLRAHDGNPVYSVTFLTAPQRPDHIVLITGGPLNREIRIWVSTSEEGWLLPSDAEFWKCTQSLELKSSSESKMEDAFFNQVVALSRAGLFLLANAKRNAIYAMHIDFGPNPSATHIDYIAEFTVTMPILSLTGTSDSLPDGEQVVQVYCVQTLAIQQYALDLSHCLPPPFENIDLEKSNSNLARAFDAANADACAATEMNQASRPNEISGGSAIAVMPAQSFGMEDASRGSQQEILAFSEATSLTEVIKSGPGNKPNASTSQRSSDNLYGGSPHLPMSPKLSRKSSGFRSPSKADLVSDHPACDFTVDHEFDGAKENKIDVTPAGDNLGKTDCIVSQNDISMVPDTPSVFKHPTHLVTPSEILSTVTSSSENTHFDSNLSAVETNVQDVGVSNDMESAEVEVNVVGEAGSVRSNRAEYTKDAHITMTEKKEKAFYSQASDTSFQMTSDLHKETYVTERASEVNDVRFADSIDKPANEAEGGSQGLMEKVVPKSSESEAVNDIPASAVKGRKQMGRNAQISGPSSSPSPYNSTDSSNEPGCSSAAPSSDPALPQLLAMQDTLVQLMSMQKEMQKQMNTIVSAPVNREGKRLEASLGKYIEKVVKANADAFWARFQEETAKHERLERDRTQQITNLITNYISKDLPAIFERSLKKEISAVGPILARAITPNLEKSISSAISESFQKGVGDKAVNQLEKSVSTKLDTTVARQIQAQFQISGRQALQDALRSSLETSIIPAFELSCKTMFEQIDIAFQKGLAQHTAATQQQSENSHSTLAVALNDAINSLTSVAQTLSGELADGQRKLLAIAASSGNSKDGSVLVKHLSNGPIAVLHEMPQTHMDPMKELSRLVAERKYEEAFTIALHRNDVSIVSWLCSQVDLHGILSTVPIPLTQGCLLALLQQLACDIVNETSKKISWMTDVAVILNPSDPVIIMHIKPIFEQVYQILGHQQSLSASPAEASSFRVLMHIIHSVLARCK